MIVDFLSNGDFFLKISAIKVFSEIIERDIGYADNKIILKECFSLLDCNNRNGILYTLKIIYSNPQAQ